MVFIIGVMLIVLGVCQAVGIGARVKDNEHSLDYTTQSDKELAIIGRITVLILIVSAGICLLCVGGP